jgi:hypothetical protein
MQRQTNIIVAPAKAGAYLGLPSSAAVAPLGEVIWAPAFAGATDKAIGDSN